VTIHSRDFSTWHALEPMPAMHGHDCAPPPATHTVASYDDAGFLCNGHLMTGLNASSYGVIYLTPSHLVDFSAGEASMRFDLSTLRTSPRDWIDLWVSPYADHLQLPLEAWLPDLNGPPAHAVHVKMESLNGATPFKAFVYRDFVEQDLGGDPATGYESVLTPSATRRDTFELRLSRTHVQFGMPAYDLWWVDGEIADLGWDQGWCSEGARLRFAAVGSEIQVSFDGGATWQPAQLQRQQRTNPARFQSYWTPAPAGTTRAVFRSLGGLAGQPWMARDVAIWAREGPAAVHWSKPGGIRGHDHRTKSPHGAVSFELPSVRGARERLRQSSRDAIRARSRPAAGARVVPWCENEKQPESTATPMERPCRARHSRKAGPGTSAPATPSPKSVVASFTIQTPIANTSETRIHAREHGTRSIGERVNIVRLIEPPGNP
jgi:hypothetical protein